MEFHVPAAFVLAVLERGPLVVLVDALALGKHRDAVQNDAMEHIELATWSRAAALVFVLVLDQTSAIWPV